MANGHGGRRKGAGRRVGATDKPHISQFWTKKQIKEFFEGMYERQKNDARIAVWCGDQLSGKAQQAVDLTSGGKPLLITDDDE